jgi:hypothetical protein
MVQFTIKKRQHERCSVQQKVLPPFNPIANLLPIYSPATMHMLIFLV